MMSKHLVLPSILLLPALLLAEDHVPAAKSGGASTHASGRTYSGRSNGNGRAGYSNRGNYNRPSSHYYRGRGSYSGRGTTGRNSGGTGRYSSGAGGMGGYSAPSIGYGRQALPQRLRHGSPRLPGRGPTGTALAPRSLSPRRMSSAPVRSAMSRITANGDFLHHVYTFNATENLTGHYYWHSLEGTDFCHYCDRWGCNWYGWCVGGAFFWTQFYWGNWWWLNPADGYWCYWYGGNWWWPEPGNQTVYIYENGNYVPGDEAAEAAQGPGDGTQGPPPSDAYADGNGGTAMNDGQDSGVEAPVPAPRKGASAEEPRVFNSPDGTVMVRLDGAARDAFLYQTVADASSKPVYLGSGVSQVLYSQRDGELRILLIMSDGSFSVFKSDGTPLDPKPVKGAAARGYES